MSLINQMLRDLEQRRSADASPSPLGGLSSSGSAIQSVNFSINYRTLTAMVVVLFVAGVAVAYLLGSQQRVLEIKDMVPRAVEIASSESAVNPVHKIMLSKPAPVAQATPPKPIKIVSSKPVAHSPVITADSKKTQHAGVADSPVLQAAVPMVEEHVEKNIEEPAADNEQDNEQDINKTIRPFTDEQQSQLAFQRGINLLGRGDQLAAQIALEESLQIAPNHIRARETLAAILLNDGRVSEAASSLRDGLQLMPDATPLAKLYARILVSQGDAADAIAALERARPAVSADPEYHALLAALYRQEKKYAQAVHTYQQVLMQRPGMASYWMGLALSQDAMGEGTQALEAFQRAQRAGGLGAEVLRYIQTRIEVLTPVTPVEAVPEDYHSNDADEFEE